ncbi:MAG: exodeoxyribonuclease VII large subunit [Pelagibacteraceae bacterium]|nr:exodeoxyribonuclease VII large subunit [Pelagibacteraceae bacterium]|tara:strand:- start:5340 stop:6572 length:1233 start_codon:yes stop_codon:yes gene_type:complete
MTDNRLIDKLDNDNIPVFNVSEITDEIRNLLEDNYPYLKIKGEISGVTKAKSGHVYLTLKDEKNNISAVIWAGILKDLLIQPKNGDEVICSGRITTFTRYSSNYNLIIDAIAYEGEGQLEKKKEELRKKLEKEGLFDEKYKKKIPFIPNLIGIITSKSGAVRYEMDDTINERFPVKRELYPVSVQGKAAVREIISAIEYFNNRKIKGIKADVLIIARGGGSIEDLWCFNDEEICRAVFNSKIPIISAIGHAPDTTLIDYVADCSAATPTEAAVIVVPIKKELIEKLNKIFKRFNKAISDFLNEKSKNLQLNFSKLKTPYQIYDQKQKEYIQNIKRFENSVKFNVENKKSKLKSLTSQLEIASPRNILKRGYVYVKNLKNDSYLKSINDINGEINIKIGFHDGIIKATTKK